MILANVELPVLIVYIVMAIGFIVMVWGIKNMNTKSSARLIVAAGAIIFFGAFIASFKVTAEGSEDARFRKNAQAFLNAKAEIVASYIAERFPEEGSAAFIIEEATNNDSESDDYYLLQEIRNRLNEKGVSCGDVLIVGETKQVIDKKTGETSEVTEDPTDATIMKKLLDQVYDKVDIVVNFAGLPNSASDQKKITFLTRKNNLNGKNNMIILNDNGLPYVEQDMLKSGRVCAIINYVTSANVDFRMEKDSVPKDPSTAFGMRYFFINPDTISDFISDNPDYFISK